MSRNDRRVGVDGAGVSRREFIGATAATAVVAPLLASADTVPAPRSTVTSAEYIVARLRQHGVDTFFGVPGATCDPLFAAAASGGMHVVVPSSDLEAAYAADGFARVRGLSAVAVTYGVGALGMAPVVAGALAERSPMLVFNGGPSDEDLRLQREFGTYFSHSNGRDDTDLRVFREITGFAQRARNAAEVPTVVDAAIRAAWAQKRPAYVEIPKHLWDARVPAPAAPLDLSVPPSGREAELAQQLVRTLNSAKRPVVLVGVEVQRHGLGPQVAALLQKWGVPWVTTYLAKGVLDETGPGFCGVYAGERSLAVTRTVVEESDALLALGCVLGRQYRSLATKRQATLINVSNDQVKQGKGAAVPAQLGPLVAALSAAPWTPRAQAPSEFADLSFDGRRADIPKAQDNGAEPGVPYDEVMRQVSGVLDGSVVVVTDTSLSMYPAAELNVAGAGGFVSNGVWQAIGFSVAAAVGVGLGGKRRPLVICGDGGFQMTAQSLSTMARLNMRSVVLVLDNGHYGIEQWLLEPSYFAEGARPPKPYLGLNRWDYAALARALGVPTVATVDSPAALRTALGAALQSAGPALVCVRVPPRNLPQQLRTT